MRLNLKGVRFSKRDVEKGIKIPKILTKDLAEDIGIHIGDGSLYKCNSKKTAYEFCYSFNATEEAYLNKVINLKKNIYNLNKFRVRRYGNEIRLKFNSLAIATFFENVFSIPVGNKSRIIDIPKQIKKSNKKIISSCIRGIVDTDFCLMIKKKNYPVIEGSSISKSLINSLEKYFNILGIRNSTRFNEKNFQNKVKKYYVINKVGIYGEKNVLKFLKIISPNNEKYKIKWAQRDLNPPPLAILNHISLVVI